MSNDVLSLISKVASAETDLLKSTFVAPVFGNDHVTASVHGMSYVFSLKNVPDPGWYRFKAKNAKRAVIEGPADRPEIEEYLKRLSAVRAVLMSREKGVYRAIPVKDGSHSLSHREPVPVYLVDDFAEEFDKVVCGYDGCNLWYDHPDPSNDPSKGTYLRERYTKLLDPKSLKFKGLTFEEKAAYSVRIAVDRKAQEEMKARLVREDVEHAGGVFRGLKEKSDHYEVTYTVDGQQYTSYVAKDATRSVISAGICLSGNDRTFDLKSLVTVMREGQRQRRIVRGHGDFGHGHGDDDDEDW
jgi:hypothetical protein